MSSGQDHQLDTLIRSVDPARFSIEAHAPGFLVRYDSKLGIAEAQRPGLLEGIFARKDRFTYYFVKRLDKPLVVKDWSARWLEGASNLELGFKYNLEIQVQDKDAAVSLVAALHRPEGSAQALRSIIEKHLYRQVSQIFQECAARGENVLNRVTVTHGAMATSSELDERVSTQVGKDLYGNCRGASFRIGLRLENLPTRHLEIEGHKTPLNIPDSKESHVVCTSARLELNNFQNFKRSGFKDGEAVKAEILTWIDNAVRRFLFEKPYYEIARNFEDEIKVQIKQYITDAAAAMGYEIKMFQALPNMEVLRLSQGLRVDMRAEDHEFRPRYSSGYVRMDVSIEVRARDYVKIARLIPPDQQNIVGRLREELEQICRDEIHKIDRKQFNLAFDYAPKGQKSVSSILQAAFKRVLHERYGLHVEIINISPAETLEKERFDAVRGKATEFELEIAAQADRGAKDKVPISGKFEIVAMAENGWDKFESKDFGFRKESVVWTPRRLAMLQQELQQSGTLTPEEFERERKSVAVHAELDQIAQRIKSILENYLSKLPDIANRSRTLANITSLQKKAEKIACDCIEEEFGVIIAFREFYRRETLAETTHAGLHTMRHQALLGRARRDIEKDAELSDVSHLQRVSTMKYLGQRKQDKMADLNEENAAAEERLTDKIDALRGESDWQAMSSSSIKSLLDETEEAAVDQPLLGQELEALKGPRRVTSKPD